MRLGFSALRHQLFQFKIIETPVCDYCSIENETTVHYLLHCPAFSLERTRLLCSLTDIIPYNIFSDLQNEHDIANCLLSGSDMLNEDMNCNVLTSVLTFIEETERFM